MDYEQAVELIKNVEAEDPASRSVVVSLADSEDKVGMKEYGEKDVEALIDWVEKVVGPQAGGVTSGGGQQPEAAQQTPGARPRETGETARTKATTDNALEKAEKELEKAVAGVGNKITEIKEKDSGEKLVLANLSISDQINELEKISFGLDGNIFTQDQRKILVTEVGGLMKKKQKTAGDFQKELASLRDRRLKEVSDKLGLK